jgi:hypothetical protein
MVRLYIVGKKDTVFWVWKIMWGHFKFANPDYGRKRADFSNISAYSVINSVFPPSLTLEKKLISTVIVLLGRGQSECLYDIITCSLDNWIDKIMLHFPTLENSVII